MVEINDLSKAVAHAVDNATDSVQDAAHTLSLAANRASRMIDNKGEQFMHAQSRLTRNFRGYVQEQPLTALGIAAASGILLGWLLRQR